MVTGSARESISMLVGGSLGSHGDVCVGGQAGTPVGGQRLLYAVMLFTVFFMVCAYH